MSKMIIKNLVVTGLNKEDASIGFNLGLNVISGSSDTGKTYVFQCLKYLLGSGSKPKENLDEAVGYTDAFLEIQVSTALLTIERSLMGGDVKVHFGDLASARAGTCKFEVMNAEAKGKNNLSKHILKLMGLSGITVVKAKTKGQKAEMHLSNFRELIFIDEGKIITNESPFLSGDKSDRSKEKTFLNYLVTGNDYKDVLLNEAGDAVKNTILANYLKGEIELETNRKKKISESISGYKNLYEIESKLLDLSNHLDKQQDLYKSIQSEKEQIQDTLIKAKSRSKMFLEIISRFNLLNEQYEVDKKRLDHLNESSDFFKLFKLNQCPVCFSSFSENHTHQLEIGFNIEDYSKSIVSERKKISILAKDLEETIKDSKTQKSKIDVEINYHTSKIKDLEARQKNISSDIAEFSIKLKSFLSIEKMSSEIESIDARISKLTGEIKQYLPEPGVKKKKETSDIDSVRIDVRTKLCSEFSQNLKKINYYSANEATFDEKSTDFIISGKPRRSFGKGYRAISYSLANLALLDLSSNVQTSMDLLILDSPLTTHDGKHEQIDGQDVISKEMEQLFFDLLYEHSTKLQIIVFDNKSPNSDLMKKITFTEFTCNNSYGRYGFFPK